MSTPASNGPAIVAAETPREARDGELRR
jgi:hypothetical protein